jgi:hypothetical protein
MPLASQELWAMCKMNVTFEHFHIKTKQPDAKCKGAGQQKGRGTVTVASFHHSTSAFLYSGRKYLSA